LVSAAAVDLHVAIVVRGGNKGIRLAWISHTPTLLADECGPQRAILPVRNGVAEVAGAPSPRVL
jgi:hypothetical protein